MFNVYTKMQSILEQSHLPTFYEHFVEESISVPCISWLELNDASLYEGDTMRYSDISVRVSVWATNLEELYTNSAYVDGLMVANGFIRTGIADLHLDNGIVKKSISYTCTSKEI